MKKICIATINLNNKDGLEKTIKSVLSQTYSDYEYVIIDGGSTDGSVDVIKKYSDKISYWVSEKDNGVFHAMNKSIDVCNSEYMLFLNSGDYFYSDNSIENALKELDCDIIYGNEEKRFKNNRNVIKKFPDKLDDAYFRKDFLPHQSTFIRTKLLKEKKYNENYKLLGDWIFLKESIIDNKVTYKHIDHIVSSFDCNGLSSNYKLILSEKKKYYLNINNANIFICTHKEFEPIVHNEAYKTINAREIEPKLPLKDDFYSELYQFKYVADNLELPKYIGFCHYRRYFDFLDDIPNLDEILNEFDCIVASPLTFKNTVKEQYGKLHNIEDLYIIGGIIADKYPEHVKMWNVFINGNIFIPYNMFIMKSDDFKEYIKFIFDILDEYIKIVGTDINKRIYDNFEKYIKVTIQIILLNTNIELEDILLRGVLTYF